MAAGVDTDCGSFFDDHLPDALDAGKVTMAQIDRALIRLTSVRMRLGYFDPPESSPFNSIMPADVDWEQHQALGLEAAREGITLVKNDGVLPLELDATDARDGTREAPYTVAVVGPNANATETLQGVSGGGL